MNNNALVSSSNFSYSITEVEITPIKPREGLIAFASFVFNNAFYFSSIGIYTKIEGGYRLTYPTKLVGNRNLQIYHPISKDVSEAIEIAIFSKLNEIFGRIF
ncbi:MAG TPA: septation protein SpoVG family protein [Methylomirabilota bacterium]|nr:septation protein SpoVG family protein [Methylomirabilota bacterium]